MNKELYMVILPAISWLLFALGGTQISDKIPGWKGWRRFILPFIYTLFCLMESTWWQAVLVGLVAVGIYSIGYGKMSWKMRFALGLGYGLVCIPIGISIWCAFTALAFGVLFILSNTKLTANTFVWKICEGFFGLFVGIEIAYILMGYGISY